MKVSAQGFQIPDALSTASDTQVASRIESRSAALGPAAEASVFRRPVWLGESIWPFQTSAFEVEGCRIAFTDVGRGPVVLFVHTGFWSFIWRDVMLRLSGDFRCICFDAPGAGQSDRLPVGRISLDRASRVLTALIEHLDLRDIILVVHDLGGPSGIAGAAALANRIRALCIVNAFAWKPSGAAFRGMLAVMGSPIIREFNAFSGILPRITATTFGVARHMDEPSRKAFLAGIGRDGIRTFHAYMRDALRAGAIYERVGRALATQFRGLPVFTIFGERNDPLSFQPRWKELFPDARQVVVSKGNHFPMCDDPDLVAMSIRELHPKWRRSQ
ncbi:MAG: alpha/beta fold hydrolase, partial [Acidobacteriaceae bacterium]|nr:alpha/beta fold hydrolase [Acidobacteriaceae bacterium]